MGFWDWLYGWLEWLGLRNKQGKLMLLGLDDSGKTTLLQCLKTGNFVQFEQTKSYHIEDLTIEGIHFQAWDLGGHELARQAWADYFLNANAVVFMVDAANAVRFDEASQELSRLLSDENLRNVPFLILGNKTDKLGCVSPDELAHRLRITAQTPENAASVPPGQRPIRLFMCSIKQKSGYAQGFRWIAKFI
jgi:GTP-binding protein SAR1